MFLTKCFSPSMIITHNSSGIDFLIFLNLLSCDKLKLCKTAGKRPLLAHVAADCGVEAPSIAVYGPDVNLLPHVEKCLALNIHQLWTVKSFQHLFRRCIGKLYYSSLKTNLYPSVNHVLHFLEKIYPPS